MLTRFKLYPTLLLLLLGAFAASAQTESAESTNKGDRIPGWWTLGINAGSSYQSSDVCRTYEGWGLGLTLAKNLYYRPGAPLAFDLRGRLLYANQRGMDYELPSYGLQYNTALNGTDRGFFEVFGPLDYYDETGVDSNFVFSNHHTDVLEFGLEGVFNLNRLREKTNVIVNLYGGLNLDWYRASIDQADFFSINDKYDYSSIDLDAPPSSIRSQLNAMWDGEYETVGDGFENEGGTFTWMPSAGLELGYQFTPRFSAVLGHKVTWSRKDIMDGQRWNNDNTPTGNNDIWHYTNLGLRWIVSPVEHKEEPPIIHIQRPKPNPYTTYDSNVAVKAEIENCYSVSDVKCTFNGAPFNNFNFNPNSEDFTCNLNLIPGRNTLVITATNTVGQDTENVIVIQNQNAPQRPPVVDITRPANPGQTVVSPNYNLVSTVKYVDNKSDIKFYFNGSLYNNFSYSDSRDEVKANLTLQPGNNTIRIVATNDDGKDEDQTSILYDKGEVAPDPGTTPCQEPIVDIQNVSTPVASPSNPNMGRSSITATIRYANSKNDIKLYVNGKNSIFSFNTGSGALSANATLKPGTNAIRIVATNNCGKDEDTYNINFDSSPTTPPCDKPTVRIDNVSNPVAIPSNPTKATSSIRATVKNVTRSQIKLYVDGNSVSGFSFNATTGKLSGEVTLHGGPNTIRIVATNDCGMAEDARTVNYVATTPCDRPTIGNMNLSTPAATPMNPNAGKSTLTATIRNVNQNQIKLYVNGNQTTGFSYNTGSGAFSATLSLQPGNNTIQLVAQNECGNAESTQSINFSPSAPCSKPTITGEKFTVPAGSDKGNFVATVKNVTRDQITYYVNGSKRNDFNYNSGSGALSSTVPLRTGENTVKLVAQNDCGGVQITQTLNYTPTAPCSKPTVAMLGLSSPSATGDTKVTTTVKNVQKSQISVYVNGKKQRSFNYNTASGALSADITLDKGGNVVKVTAQNDCGSAEASQEISFDPPKPCDKPTVAALGLSAPSETGASKVTTTVKNVSKDQITVSVNGNKLRTFSYNSTSGALSANITLQKGSNTVKVVAKNDCGTAEKGQTMSFDPPAPCDKPTVGNLNLSTPAATPMNPNAGKSTVTATVRNVSKSQISFYVNGSKVTSFSYNTGSGAFSASATLKPGSNSVKLVAKNDCGTAEKSQTVTFNAPKPPSKPKPEVTITDPASSGKKTTKPAYMVKATIKNVSSKSGVTFMFNGKKISTFTFNPRSGQLTAPVNLKAGSNTIKITGTNSEGSDSKSTSIVYNAPNPGLGTNSKPTVKITNLSTPAATPMNPNAGKSTLTAKVTKVTDKRNITLKLNGTVITDFQFNSSTGVITAQLTMKKGSNKVEVIARNRSGSNKATEEVNF